MAGSTSVNSPFLVIGSHQVHLRDYCSEVNVRHILGDVVNHIDCLGFVPLSNFRHIQEIDQSQLLPRCHL